jgi:hypothetical protein
MSAFCRQFAERTGELEVVDGAEEVVVQRHLAAALAVAGDLLLFEVDEDRELLLEDARAYATASSGRTLPSVVTSSTRRS